MKLSIPIASIWQSYENALYYKVLDVEGSGPDAEIIATTRIRQTPLAADSFSWSGTAAEFLNHFKPAPQHVFA